MNSYWVEHAVSKQHCETRKSLKICYLFNISQDKVYRIKIKYDIERIEKVQRRFTKRLHGFSGLSCNDRLKQLNMYSLEHRRLYFDLLWCYKLLFGLVRVNRDDFFTLRSCSTRGHPYKIFKIFLQSCNGSVRSNFLY